MDVEPADLLREVARDLRANSLWFRGGPVEAHVQFTTFCNMSCVMCWDGDNPPIRDIDPAVLDAVGELVDQGLVLVIPHDGSEPTARRWSSVHGWARDHGVRLGLTTNVQTLTGPRLLEAIDVLDHVILSIDSHEPELLERIRPGARAEAVLGNARTVSALAREHGLPVSANVVLLAENIDTVHQTVSWLADIGVEDVTVVRMVDINGRSAVHDPFVVAGPEQIELAHKRCDAAAEAAGIDLWWSVDEHDKDESDPPPRQRHHVGLALQERYAELRWRHPGHCRFAHSAVRIGADGEVTPCGYAARGELTLGRLPDDPIEQIWNGPSARDLRRAMYTRDLPALCATCQHAVEPGASSLLTFLTRLPPVAESASPPTVAAAHDLVRSEDPPAVAVKGLPVGLRSVEVAVSHGGDGPVARWPVAYDDRAGTASVTVPPERWEVTTPNQGYWWTLVGRSIDGQEATLLREARCFVRHEAMPRVPGSRLRYAPTSETPVDLGLRVPVAAPVAPGTPVAPSAAAADGPGRWSEQVRETASLMGRARSVLAYGGLDGIIHRPLFHPTGTFPQFTASAQGCRLTDTAGRTYLDWSNGWGPVMLGYRYEPVERAIVDQLVAGPTTSLMHPVEIEVAERICDLVPSAEMVVFAKNGSDALAAAVRVARAATGREVILQHGFHGFHEWYLSQFEDVQGIPAFQRQLVHPFPYADLDALAALFDEHDGRVAAVVMEPLNTFEPPPGYLAGVRDLAHRHGAVLVFDEVLTGFRTSRGGAQLHYGVEPDLTCLGKAMGNGMPLSALAGRRELMQLVPSVGFGLTFRGETLSLAAARVVLDAIATQPVNDHLAAVGTRMRERFERTSREIGLPCQVLGHPSRLTLGFEPTETHGWETIRAMFLRECMREGLITNGVLLPSWAHDEEAVLQSLDAMEFALRTVRDQLEADGDGGDAGPRFGGSPYGPRAYLGTGFLDLLRIEGGRVDVGGWVHLADRSPVRIEVLAPSGATTVVGPPEGSTIGRFAATLPLRDLRSDDGVAFTLRAHGHDGARWECQVLVAGEVPEDHRPFPLDDGVLYL
jgi:radical SAM protein with 4Fe4S-binding SPASM domain